MRNQPRAHREMGAAGCEPRRLDGEHDPLMRPVARPTGDRRPRKAAESTAISTAAHQAFWLLRIGFTVAPILFGLDKFFNWSVHWPDYLAGWIDDIAPGAARTSCTSSAGSRSSPACSCWSLRGSARFVVAAWLAGIIVNLLTKNPPEYYDIALRDFGLMLGALTLGRLAIAVVPPERRACCRGCRSVAGGN